MRKPYDFSNPPQWASEADVLESMRGLWEEAFVADAARMWFARRANATADGRERTAQLLLTVAHACRHAANMIQSRETTVADAHTAGRRR